MQATRQAFPGDPRIWPEQGQRFSAAQAPGVLQKRPHMIQHVLASRSLAVHLAVGKSAMSPACKVVIATPD